jgi:uncharacterized DUF497 family protein
MINADYEWDEDKRKINLEKHNFDFIDAIEIFRDLERIECMTQRNDEIRYQTIGEINNMIVLVVYTNRMSKKRIISARRASKHEREAYIYAE